MDRDILIIGAIILFLVFGSGTFLSIVEEKGYFKETLLMETEYEKGEITIPSIDLVLPGHERFTKENWQEAQGCYEGVRDNLLQCHNPDEAWNYDNDDYLIFLVLSNPNGEETLLTSYHFDGHECTSVQDKRCYKEYTIAPQTISLEQAGSYKLMLKYFPISWAMRHLSDASTDKLIAPVYSDYQTKYWRYKDSGNIRNFWISKDNPQEVEEWDVYFCQLYPTVEDVCVGTPDGNFPTGEYASHGYKKIEEYAKVKWCQRTRWDENCWGMFWKSEGTKDLLENSELSSEAVFTVKTDEKDDEEEEQDEDEKDEQEDIGTMIEKLIFFQMGALEEETGTSWMLIFTVIIAGLALIFFRREGYL